MIECLADDAAHRGETSSRPRRRRKRPPPGFITVADLAERSGAAPSTAYHWLETGALAAYRWRGIFVVAERDVEEFIAVQPLRRSVADAEAAEVRHG